MNFCNSHVISTSEDMGTMRTMGYMVGYMDRGAGKFCRCLNCGMDGEEHLDDNKCDELHIWRRSKHIPTFQELTHVYFAKFLEDMDLKRERFKNEIL